jgi:tetratricopeptide (TPR) repeat protein
VLNPGRLYKHLRRMEKPSIQQAFDLAVRHHKAGQLQEAEKLYRQILAQQPQHMEALHLLGVIAHQAGHVDSAVDLIRRAISLNPNIPQAHNDLGNALKDKGQLDDAIAAYRQAIALNPGFAEAQTNLGNALKDKGQLDEAISVYRQAIALRPKYAGAYGNLGVALKIKGEVDEAIASYQRAITLRPNYPEAYYNLGIALKEKGRLDEAVAAFRQAISQRPNFSEAYNNLGDALTDKGELNEAIAACRQAIAQKPSNAEAYYNLGNALVAQQRFDEAIDLYRQSIAIKPNRAEVHFNLASALLMRGEFQQGWEEYEWRWKLKEYQPLLRNFPQPRWDGSGFEGRTLLLHAEQGLGDVLQFIRYLPIVAQRGGKIILECQAELQRLFQAVAGMCEIVVRGRPLPPFDLHCPLLSLPRVFGTDLSNLPKTLPYLSPEPALIDAWSRTLGPADGQMRVGLAWAGSPRFKGDRTRSMNLRQLAPFAAIRGIKFYSLQKGPAEEQAKNPPVGLELVDLGPGLKDFVDTAAAMSLMDLIITTDTSVPHLAGALGRPVWVMLQFVPDFRWLLERDDSPWYPTMRLFRQSARGDWDGVAARVAEALSAWIKNRG